jgi:NitT/TauT family transport system ATP-binding protein
MDWPAPNSPGARAGAPKVELRKVGLHYFGPQGESHAFAEISLSVCAGEFVAIIGPSGCGKSSLLSLISGILEPTAGDVRIDGRPVLTPSRAVGYMLQQDYLFEWRTILQNTLLGAEIQQADMRKARERAMELLTLCGLGNVAHHLPRQLSGGMRQRAALARTLCTGPDIVLLDEPFSALDSQTRIALADDVSEILRREGKTAILVTHDIAEAVSMADRVIVMSRGPGRLKSEHAIGFAHDSLPGASRPTPFEARSTPEFTGYFNILWRELDVHVHG